MCVINALEDMYKHVHKVAVTVVGRALRHVYIHNESLRNTHKDSQQEQVEEKERRASRAAVVKVSAEYNDHNYLLDVWFLSLKP
jgi:hypothetical protein